MDGFFKKAITYAKISPKMVIPTDIARSAGEEEVIKAPA